MEFHAPSFSKVMYVLRDYQRNASNAALNAFCKTKRNGLLVLPTGSGKSLVIADIAAKLDKPLIVFCPSKEILEQNVEKFRSYGILDFGVYSASAGCKDINRITFATIGSVNNHVDDFKAFRYVLVDEAHFVNSKGGMYENFIHDTDRIVVGLTATPYRLSRSFDGGSELKFLTRTRPRVFSDVLYFCQIGELLSKGFLAELRYFDVSNRISFNIDNVRTNSTGSDYDEKSLMLEFERSGFAADLFNWTIRVLKPNDGSKRNGVLVFTRFVKESESLVRSLNEKGVKAALVTGNTPKKEREEILSLFKQRKIDVVANANCLAVGFDYPELDTVILASPTKSLARYYQQVGRIIRPHKQKKCGWVIDMCSNYKRFGAVSDLMIERPFGTQKWMITSKGRQLTNKSF